MSFTGDEIMYTLLLCYQDSWGFFYMGMYQEQTNLSMKTMETLI